MSHRDRRIPLLVVGAGPAGSAAAIEARRRGSDVVVVDKTHFPRDKCCGDGLTAGALRQLDDLGVPVPTLPSACPVGAAVLVDPKGRERTYPLPRGKGLFAAVVRRKELDTALVDAAVEAGADVRPRTTLTRIESAPNGDLAVELQDANGRYRLDVDHLVAADGMWSPTRRLLGIGPGSYRGAWHAFRQYFAGVGPRARRELIVWFEPDILPGYVWSFPVGDGAANVGFGILRDRGRPVQDMGALWPEILSRPHIRRFLGDDARPEDRHRAWPIPADLGRLPLSAGRVLFVGDAAAATDPLTGEGIGQALETGRLAVRCIMDAGRDHHAAAAAYETTLARTLIPDHRLARILSSGMSTPRGAGLALGIAGATSWTRRNFGRWLFEDYPRATLGTAHRWRRGVFAQPGAFPATARS